MILFYIQEAFRIFRKSSIATAITISITTIAVILSTVSIFIFLSANSLSEKIKRSIEINVYLDETLSDNELDLLKKNIQNQNSVLNVKFVDKDEAEKLFLQETGQGFKTVLDQNPLPNSFIVKLKPKSFDESNLDIIAGNLKSMKGVSDVVYDYRTVFRILNLLKSFEVIIYLISVTLILFATYLVYSNNKIQIFGNRNLYMTMKLVGAHIKTMKIPIILNGIFIGLISSLICCVLVYIVFTLLTKVYLSLKFTYQMQYIYIIVLLIGIMLGFVGSFISSMKISLLLNEK